MKIGIVGSGYVGLTTGTCFAHLGNKVTCIDIDKRKVSSLRSGKVPFFEPKLEPMVRSNMEEGRLSFTTDISEGVKDKDAIFLCVGTPTGDDGHADLSFLLESARQTVQNINRYTVIVEKSTVPAGTAEAMMGVARQHAPHAEYDVAVNPEFLREGTAVDDFLKPDRIVIGTNSRRANSVMTELYRPLNAPMFLTDMTTAEIIKHGSNAFLSMKISYANMVAALAEATGADALVALKGIGMDRRIGIAFLNPGIGYGGYCFPKDIAAFLAIHRKNGVEAGLLAEVIKINYEQRRLFVQKIERTCDGIEGKTFAVFGLAFKPNTDDMRCAPSSDIIKALTEKGARIRAYDPQAMENAKTLPEFRDVEFCRDAYTAATDADAVLVLTEWKEFEDLDMVKIRKLLKAPIVVDGRNVYRAERMKQLGFKYVGIGRGAVDTDKSSESDGAESASSA